MAIGIIISLLINDFLVIFQITGNSLLAAVSLADDLSVVAIKVAAGSLDDIANQTAKSLSQTAGLLVDDTAAIPQYVSNTAAKDPAATFIATTDKSSASAAIYPINPDITTYLPPLQ
jgi:hypothetical protein